MPTKHQVVSHYLHWIGNVTKRKLKFYRMKFLDDRDAYDFYAFRISGFYNKAEAEMEKRIDERNLQLRSGNYRAEFLQGLENALKDWEKERTGLPYEE